VTVQLTVDGQQVEVEDDTVSLLDALRDGLGNRAVKDGCSPQGQCGCCTVLVDGAPRVACVTPVRRVAGRTVTTIDGLDPARREQWAEAFCATGASQCGFCTPGIVVRLEGVAAKGVLASDSAAIDRALAAHLCRCTGWQTIVEAYGQVVEEPSVGDASETPVAVASPARDLGAASVRASLEGGSPQVVAPSVALGRAGFADDTAPIPGNALVAIPGPDGSWAVGETLAEARAKADKVQGRRTTVAPSPPLAVPDGDWVRTLRTSWVEPAYLETDASWCSPDGEPVTPLANGGAFGGKVASIAPAAARDLARQLGRPVRVLLAREDTVRLGPKRPPIAAGLRADGTGVIRVVRTEGIAAAIASVAPRLVVEEVDWPSDDGSAGPATSVAIRAAGWAEAAVLLHSLGPRDAVITAPNGAIASATIDPSDGSVRVQVRCGAVLDAVVLRSYCIGAAHMALGWVRSEQLTVDPDTGEILDLTIRSFGVLRASETPHIEVTIEEDDGPPINGSDAVFAAVAAAAWRAAAFPPAWPVLR